MEGVCFFNSAITPPAKAPLGLCPVFPDQVIGCMRVGSWGGGNVGIEKGVVIWRGGDQLGWGW